MWIPSVNVPLGTDHEEQKNIQAIICTYYGCDSGVFYLIFPVEGG